MLKKAIIRKIVIVILCMFMLIFFCSCYKQELSVKNKAKENRPENDNISSNDKNSLPQDKSSTNNQDSDSDNDSSSDEQDSFAALSSEIKLTLDMPDEWIKFPNSELPAHYTKEEGIAVFMIMNIGAHGDNLDDVVEAIRSSNELMYQNLVYDGETEKIKVDNVDARKFICSYNLNKLPMKSMFIYFLWGDDTYVISFSTHQKNIDGFDDWFSPLIDDFEFILENMKIE